jgi:hypothetical protein
MGPCGQSRHPVRCVPITGRPTTESSVSQAASPRGCASSTLTGFRRDARSPAQSSAGGADASRFVTRGLVLVVVELAQYRETWPCPTVRKLPSAGWVGLGCGAEPALARHGERSLLPSAPKSLRPRHKPRPPQTNGLNDALRTVGHVTFTGTRGRSNSGTRGSAREARHHRLGVARASSCPERERRV